MDPPSCNSADGEIWRFLLGFSCVSRKSAKHVTDYLETVNVWGLYRPVRVCTSQGST